ncbi:AbrB family transcriptional regulator [Sulfitobacter sp. JBTF-M27]|uniref:AbrB family transcriptional regulator n=1 Tax=Sulfitobacter sediminilitoris TaxID=2698830 RepID=A0A6P0C6K6_9RHOB|nr:AbrB family transcriptional regulator [Sulfitobacter sediminilitoris]NEK20885.1 AbrB family transcriptional regulator [Sulfitobacter sediminilitoris]
MQANQLSTSGKQTALTVAVGAVGALVGWMLSAPVFMLLGPAVAVSLAGLGGIKVAIDPRLRDTCFVILGLAVGAGFNADALAAMIRWPLAFGFMALVMWAILVTCRGVLVRVFGFEPRAALLAAAPGHLSFVVAMAADLGSDLARISITQSVRLLSLTILVPFIALAMGIEVSSNIAPQGMAMPYSRLIGLFVVSIGAGLLFIRLGVPAPLLMGAMVVSALGHLTNWAPGVLPEWMILPAYLVLGALIGTRFSGITFADLRRGLAAGLAVTGIAVTFAGLAAVPVAWALGMPVAHVLVAFAPGGLETMIAMGAVLGVVPGFVAACHIARLFVLTFLLPMLLARTPGS